MDAPENPLRPYDVGTFEYLSARFCPADLVVVTVPPVEALLQLLTRQLGRDLTPDEVAEKRRMAPSVVLPRAEAAKLREPNSNREEE